MTQRGDDRRQLISCYADNLRKRISAIAQANLTDKHERVHALIEKAGHDLEEIDRIAGELAGEQ